MNKFVLSADSTCDMYQDEKKAKGVFVAPMKFIVDKDGKIDEYLDDFNSIDEYKQFYAKLRDGAVSRTSMLTQEDHFEHFEKIVKEGHKVILHFSLSSGLSPTVEKAQLAGDEISKKYPDVKVFAFDSLTATVAMHTLLNIAIKMRDEGKTAEEVIEYLSPLRTKIQHFICVDDLFFLHRGGRVSKAAAVAGTVLNLKPMVSFNSIGKLEVIDKIRGMKKTFSSVIERIQKMPPNEKEFQMIIVHNDNEEKATELKNLVKEKLGYDVDTHYMGPVIGTHVGPGGVSLAYISTVERNSAK